MKKTILAITAGALLVAGQAAAAGSTGAAARVGDRVGAPAGATEEFAGIPIAVLLVGGAIIAAAVVAINDDSESD